MSGRTLIFDDGAEVHASPATPEIIAADVTRGPAVAVLAFRLPGDMHVHAFPLDEEQRAALIAGLTAEQS